MIAWQCTPSTLRSTDGSIDGFRPVVERARQNAGRGGLADTAHAGEHPRLRDPARRKRVGEGADHRLLADQF
jgi:hypothetical protein